MEIGAKCKGNSEKDVAKSQGSITVEGAFEE